MINKIWRFLTGYSIGESKSVESLPIPESVFQVTVDVPREEWAPGLWAGSEGVKLTVVKIDLENRKLTLEF